MKTTKLAIMLFVFVMIVGCVAPIVSAKPKTNYVKAIGKVAVNYNNELTLKGIISIDATMTPGGYSEFGGVAIVAMHFVLPD